MAVDKDVYEFHIIYNTEKAFITLKGRCHQTYKTYFNKNRVVICLRILSKQMIIYKVAKTN